MWIKLVFQSAVFFFESINFLGIWGNILAQACLRMYLILFPFIKNHFIIPNILKKTFTDSKFKINFNWKKKNKTNPKQIQYVTQTRRHHTESTWSVPLLCEIKVKAVNFNAVKSVGAASSSFFLLHVKIPCPTTKTPRDPEAPPWPRWHQFNETHALPAFGHCGSCYTWFQSDTCIDLLLMDSYTGSKRVKVRSRLSDSHTYSPPDTQNSMVKAEDQVL